MDFVVSRVCMAISALVVLGVLSGLLTSDPSYRPVDELERILRDLCRSVDLMAAQRTPGECRWDVPCLSSGESFCFEVISGAVMAECSGRSVLACASVPLRTWAWSGQVLNESELKELDEAAPPLKAFSGAKLTLTSSAIPVSGVERVVVFASVAR